MSCTRFSDSHASCDALAISVCQSARFQCETASTRVVKWPTNRLLWLFWGAKKGGFFGVDAQKLRSAPWRTQKNSAPPPRWTQKNPHRPPRAPTFVVATFLQVVAPQWLTSQHPAVFDLENSPRLGMLQFCGGFFRTEFFPHFETSTQSSSLSPLAGEGSDFGGPIAMGTPSRAGVRALAMTDR